MDDKDFIIDIVSPDEDCYNEDGQIDKKVYMTKLNSLNKHDLKKTKNIVQEFLNITGERYYRLEILDTNYGCVYNLIKKDIDIFHKQLLEDIYSVCVDIKAFNFTGKSKNSLEIWGINDKDEGIILFVYPYDCAVCEIGGVDK